jgi:hypothetical protein
VTSRNCGEHPNMATSKFIMKVEKALEELVTLKIVTAVG